MPAAPENGASASATAMPCRRIKIELMHNLQMLEGSLCPCWNSTKPSSRWTSLPSNWKIQRRNHTARKMLRTHRPGLGSPCHVHGNTTLSSLQTSLPASLQIHHCNCMGRQALAAGSPALAARWAALAARWAELALASAAERSSGTHGDESGSTNSSSPLPKCSPHRRRN